MAWLAKIFKLRENKTTVATEVRAGVVTFLTMSYIVFVQPIILSGTGLSWNTVFVATCVSSAIATLLMAFFANYPIALAPAMGHNFLFLMYCRDGTVNWQTGLGAVFVSGTIFVVLSFWGIREKIINAIPSCLKHAIAVGIGLLIAFLGFQWAGLVVDAPGTLVKMGPLGSKPVLLALGGLAFTAGLIALRLRGAILIGILVTAAVGVPLGITSTEAVKERGLFAMPSAAPKQKLVVLRPPGDEASPAVEALAAAAREDADTFESVQTGLVPHVAEEIKAAPSPSRSGSDTIGLRFRRAEGEELCKLAREQFKCDLILVAEIKSSEGGKTLGVTAYVAEKAGVVWRRHGPIAFPASEGALRALATEVALGLPGHPGLFKLDILGALKLGLLHVIFIFLFLDLFDTIGTLIGVAQQAGFLRDGKLPRARGALLADAFGTVIGAGMGTSTVTSYVESAAGVADGARTGLANVVTALLFIAALFFSPVVKMIGGDYQLLHPAVAPVLIIIGSIMLRNVIHIAWTDPTEALPAFLAIMMMPLTFSITEGIAFGFISYSFLKLVTGRGREVHWLVYLFSVLFIVRYVYVGT